MKPLTSVSVFNVLISKNIIVCILCEFMVCIDRILLDVTIIQLDC